ETGLIHSRALMVGGESLGHRAIDAGVEDHADMRTAHLGIVGRIVLDAARPVGDAVLTRVDRELRYIDAARHVHVAHELTGTVSGTARCMQIPPDEATLRRLEPVPDANDGR